MWLTKEHECYWGLSPDSVTVCNENKEVVSIVLGEISKAVICVLSFRFNFSSHLSILIFQYNIFSDSNRMRGSLPDEVGALSALEVLNLSYNDIEGTLPSALGRMLNLAVLDLESNNFSGLIPPDIGALEHLGKCCHIHTQAFCSSHMAGVR